MAGKKKQDAGFDPLGWMFTFSDLVTLLLTFFVMLLAMKQPEVLKFKAAFGFFAGGGSTGVMALTDQPGVQAHRRIMDQIETANPAALQEAQQELAAILDLPSASQFGDLGGLQQGVQIRQEPRGTVITLANDLLFGPGQAQLSPQAAEAVKKIAHVLGHGSTPISVEGHTDTSAPGAGSKFTNNWSLSLARAHSVLLALINGGVKPDRLRLAALGDTRPLVPNDTPERRAMNRRTEIVLLAQPKP